MSEDILYTSKDGLKLHAKAYGPADAETTVICIHGLTRNHKDFEPMISALGDTGYRFVSVDVRGRCQSEWDKDPKNYQIPVYAQDMIDLMDHLRQDKVILFGTSMGGLISMALAKLAPERIIGVVLNDIGPEIDTTGLQRIGGYVGKIRPLPSWEAAAEAAMSINGLAFPDWTKEDFLQLARQSFRQLESGEVIADYDPDIRSANPALKQSRMLRFILWRLFAKLKAYPLLVIRGELSDILAQKAAERMVRRHGNAELAVIPRVGHAPFLNEPKSIEAIKGFLAKLKD